MTVKISAKTRFTPFPLLDTAPAIISGGRVFGLRVMSSPGALTAGFNALHDMTSDLSHRPETTRPETTRPEITRMNKPPYRG